MPRLKRKLGLDWSDRDAVNRYHRERKPSTSRGIKPASGSPQAVRVNGVDYKSLSAAAQSIGVTRQWMSVLVKRHGNDIEF